MYGSSNDMKALEAALCCLVWEMAVQQLFLCYDEDTDSFIQTQRRGFVMVAIWPIALLICCYFDTQ